MNNFLIVLPQMLQGILVTLQVFSLTLVFSIPLGVIAAQGTMSKFKPLKYITNLYVLIMRGTPLMLQIVFIYYGLPIVGIIFDRMPAALIALTLNYAAYFAEIFRAGISSIDDGQQEAGEVLGLSSIQIYFKIILPQAFKIILPPFFNEVVNLVKDTSLIYVVGIEELLKVGKIASNRYASLMPLFVAGIFYLILIGFLTKISKIIEKRLSYYK